MKIDVKNLSERNGSWFYRRTIPEDLRGEVFRKGKPLKREWTATLGRLTKISAMQAALMAEREGAAYDRAIANARKAQKLAEAASQSDVVTEMSQPALSDVQIDDALEFYRMGYGARSFEAGEVMARIDARVHADYGFDVIHADRALQETIWQKHASVEELAVIRGKTLLLDVLKEDERRHKMDRDKHRRPSVETLVEVIGNVGIADLTRDNIRDWYRHMADELNYAHSSIRRRQGALSGVINRYWRESQKPKPYDLFTDIPIPGERNEKGAKLPLTEEQVRKLAEHLRRMETGETTNGKRASLRNIAIMWLCLTSTLGPAEAGGLEEADIVLDHQTPHVVVRNNSVRKMKEGRVMRYAPLIGDALRLANHLPYRADRPFNGASLSTLLNNKYLKPAIPDLIPNKQSLYSTRHRMIQRFRELDASPEDSRWLSGHSIKDVHDRVYGSDTISDERLARLAELVKNAVRI